MDAQKVLELIGAEAKGRDPAFALREELETILRHEASLKELEASLKVRYEALLKALDTFGQNCAFGERCVRCKSAPTNCVTRIKKILEG